MGEILGQGLCEAAIGSFSDGGYCCIGVTMPCTPSTMRLRALLSIAESNLGQKRSCSCRTAARSGIAGVGVEGAARLRCHAGKSRAPLRGLWRAWQRGFWQPRGRACFARFDAVDMPSRGSSHLTFFALEATINQMSCHLCGAVDTAWQGVSTLKRRRLVFCIIGSGLCGRASQAPCAKSAHASTAQGS